MKTCRLWAVLVALLLLSTTIQSLAAKDTETQGEIDLKLTSALIKQWATRTSFPESITFAYYHVYMARALGEEISTDIRHKITAYIADCQQPDGGFTPKPLHTKTASVIYTYYALNTLDLLNETRVIDRQAAERFVRARVQPDGGIVATSRQGEQANLATTYYGVEALRLLGDIDSLDKSQLLAFIQRYREKGRGYTRVEGGISIPQATFMGVRVLQTLGALTGKKSNEVISYLKSTRYSGLIVGQKYPLLPNTESMAATLETFAALSAVNQADTARIQAFIDSLYVSANGGFGPRPGLGTTPASTYHAILSLVNLGKLPDPATRKPSSRSVAGK